MGSKLFRKSDGERYHKAWLSWLHGDYMLACEWPVKVQRWIKEHLVQMCRADGALGRVCMGLPALTRWANMWHAYGVRMGYCWPDSWTQKKGTIARRD
jgi:hypothetical protein